MVNTLDINTIGAYVQPVFAADQAFAAGALAACLVTWFTFLPSFLFILAGGPVVESTHGQLKFTAPLTAITAAVVGVIANLALVVAVPVLFGEVGRFQAGPVDLPAPVLASLDPRAAIVAAVGFAGLFVFHLGMFRTLGICAALGLVLRLAV